MKLLLGRTQCIFNTTIVLTMLCHQIQRIAERSPTLSTPKEIQARSLPEWPEWNLVRYLNAEHDKRKFIAADNKTKDGSHGVQQWFLMDFHTSIICSLWRLACRLTRMNDICAKEALVRSILKQKVAKTSSDQHWSLSVIHVMNARTKKTISQAKWGCNVSDLSAIPMPGFLGDDKC